MGISTRLPVSQKRMGVRMQGALVGVDFRSGSIIASSSTLGLQDPFTRGATCDLVLPGLVKD